jgi:lipid-binding SYLF domain-containing protein
MHRLSLAMIVVLATAVGAVAALRSNEIARLQAASKIVQDFRSSIPTEYWDRARCTLVIPELKKAAFLFGGEYGRGLVSCRGGDQWSAPLFMELARGSWGFQAGAQQVDLVMLIMNESGVQKLLTDKVTLGADASVAAGPIGRQGAVATDAALNAEILSYSRAQGLFAGVDLSGGILRPDEEANKNAYGANASPRTIMASREISAPPEAMPFLERLGSARSTAASAPKSPSASDRTARTGPAEARGPERSTQDDDVRTRAVHVQEALDHILAEAVPLPVGTTGSPSRAAGDPIAVDRFQLLQLRQKIDELIAAIDNR